MKKIFHGKVYDTEKAKKLGVFCSEHLYKKKTGEYFLYSETTEKINPLSYEDAQKWAKDNLSPVEYTKFFDVLKITDSKKKQCLNIYLPSPTVEKAKKSAEKKSISVSEYIRMLIDN